MKTKAKKMAYRYWNKPTKVGYNRRGYNFNKSVRAYKKLGSWNHVKDGSGHKAGESWAASKGIDPSSRVTRYSKNSPSFDEGVYTYKQKMKGMATKVK